MHVDIQALKVIMIITEQAFHTTLIITNVSENFLVDKLQRVLFETEKNCNKQLFNISQLYKINVIIHFKISIVLLP